MDQGIYWFPIGDFHLPYMREIYDMTDDTIVCMGFFYVEPETLPIEALLYKNNINYEDDEDRDFSGFPRHYLQSETIEIKYKILGRLGKTPEDDEFFKKATDKDVVNERNNMYVRARQEREQKERKEKWQRDNPELAARIAATLKEKSDFSHKNGIQ
jgi:hypothetical protein